MQKGRVEAILKALRAAYPGARSRLKYRNPFELLVAAILSAQTTDDQVNKVTAELFRRYPTPAALAAADPEEVAACIKSLGLYRMKAAHLVAACRTLVREYGGRVPDKLEDLLRLPGVGRKVANVVLSNAYGRDVIAVDTHVFRVANRLGLARAGNVLETEKQLMAILPPGTRGEAHHLLIHHGRAVCRARRPECRQCVVSSYCSDADHKSLGKASQ
ncbi:MAG: endonuclease [Moorella sp. (in: firmicutes)]|jgi:endonuclease-3|uniref:endonuclease III n=1 Tax=unclassified Neomoorella TaxID=2676739 RepID=UPI0010FFB951|nr:MULTISPECIES: endonuclease III [unclassified Moorella (in: firmicutes)]MDK2815830.1 endonuclease [Moorella sp. (in: firmicutes)]MDK2893877.1 endonuclease [Moorella sp. (in: firmicutes)]GEA13835.1 endonuclease III [Moorella sp. E308F]GEA18799.1 endonuclease III [Moorella sp. E306M]